MGNTQVEVIRLDIPSYAMAWPNILDRVVYAFLLQYGPMDRGMLVNLANMPRTTLFVVLKRLKRDGWVATKYEKIKRGRPHTIWLAFTPEERETKLGG